MKKIESLIESGNGTDKSFYENTSIQDQIKEILFPEELETLDDFFTKYPDRSLIENSIVSRVAPSPTGFMHIGTLYVSLISERLAHQNNGVFFLRIEDTDKNREVNGAIEMIIESLKTYGINIDEGEIEIGKEKGNYGPYKQSNRSKIYKGIIKGLYEKGDAYPCFATKEELSEIRDFQANIKTKVGYYGQWAKWRNKSNQDVLEELKKGTPYVIRFKSNGDSSKKISINDLVKGNIELPENENDIVILKQDGLPTYHFAHAVDDGLMKTTHVIRGDEWLSSLPLHLELFDRLGFKYPNYAHISPIQKIEGESGKSKVKLSKRNHPEASLSYYSEEGYPKQAVIEYLLNLIDSNFSGWRLQNPDLSYTEFKLSVDHLGSTGGALLDLSQLDNISKDLISRYTSEDLYNELLKWSANYNKSLNIEIIKNKELVISILGIERGVNSGGKARKDFSKMKDIEYDLRYFLDENIELNLDLIQSILSVVNKDSLISGLNDFISMYSNIIENKDNWFGVVKIICERNNFAVQLKKYNKNPEDYSGSVVHFTNFIRFLLTGKTQSPDLFQIMSVMGEEKVLSRLGKGNILLK